MKKEELLKKIDAINEIALSEKTVLNRSIYKIEVLKNYKTDKTARRILRKKQFELSKKVLKFAKIKDDANLKIASSELEKFYKEILISRNKFSNISIDKESGQIINFASELSLMK